ncbi:TPA: hypothetical protein ACLE2E_002558 [Klebsiella pneumoniae]
MKKISLPKIGIRPVIDGRRMGVRESLEAQTMNMAKATAALISEKLRHACGARVECVIADTCIAGMAESAACEEKFSSQNVGVTITVTPCWCYGSETIDMDPLRPKAIWGFNGTERPGAVYLAAALDGSCQQRDAQGNPTMKPHWEIEQSEADACLAATEWCPAIHEYFRGGGFSSRFLTEGGVPFTMTRVNIIKGLGPVLQIAEGWSVALPKAMHDQLDARTNSTWPTTWFAPRLTGKGPFSDVYSVMANWGANHGVLTIGHVGADFITLAAMLRIPVCMRNVEEAKIYRPSAWAAHGMDIEGQDYRACQNYGPLYKR